VSSSLVPTGESLENFAFKTFSFLLHLLPLTLSIALKIYDCEKSPKIAFPFSVSLSRDDDDDDEKKKKRGNKGSRTNHIRLVEAWRCWLDGSINSQ
jgi:hypothetical protein